MPDGMRTPDEFEQEKDNTIKINHLYRLVYELYKKRRWNTARDSIKTIFGGFLGAIAFMFGKMILWK